jgi:hypothetical protein
LNVWEISDFMQDDRMAPDDIRKTVDPLQWKFQKKKVVDDILKI